LRKGAVGRTDECDEGRSGGGASDKGERGRGECGRKYKGESGSATRRGDKERSEQSEGIRKGAKGWKEDRW